MTGYLWPRELERRQLDTRLMVVALMEDVGHKDLARRLRRLAYSRHRVRPLIHKGRKPR